MPPEQDRRRQAPHREVDQDLGDPRQVQEGEGAVVLPPHRDPQVLGWYQVKANELFLACGGDGTKGFAYVNPLLSNLTIVNMSLFVEIIKFALRGMPIYSLVSMINNSELYEVDDSTYNDDGRLVDLPDGLIHLTVNLVELLVDICDQLGSAIFMQKACQGIPGIYVTRVAPVPNSEVYHLFSVRSRTSEISEAMWARMKGGNYKGDLAEVVSVNNTRKKVTVKLILRIDLQALAAKFGKSTAISSSVDPDSSSSTSFDLLGTEGSSGDI